MIEKKEKKKKRQKSIRSKILGTKKRPRLSVFRSLNYIYVQLIDDKKGKTMVSAGDKGIKKGNKTEKAFKVGEEIAKKALGKKIEEVIFDRSGYKYHGRVKALAEGARKGGLKF